MKRMTTAYTPKSQKNTFDSSVFFNGKPGIGGTTRIKATGRGLERREESLIKNDNYEEKLFNHGHSRKSASQ
jgi:hypothetical protein